MYLNRGYELEDRLHCELRQLRGVRLYTEKELTRLYGWLASSVDFLLETDSQLIFIQVKFLSTRRKESVNINKFLSSIRHIRECIGDMGKKEIMGMWVARLQPFEDNSDLLRASNIKVVSCYESMDTLISRAVECLA